MPEFVDHSPPGECIFCRIVRAELPAAKVHEDALTLAFMDIGQVTPGHVLVATKRHAATLLELTHEEAGAVMQAAQQIAKAQQAAFAPAGITLLQANGAAGGQTVAHFHVHVVARDPGDGVSFAWPRKQPGADVIAGYAQRLRAALG